MYSWALVTAERTPVRRERYGDNARRHCAVRNTLPLFGPSSQAPLLCCDRSKNPTALEATALDS
jgi:hypothetical protein